MNIANNSLGDRLNQFKNQKSSPEESQQPNISQSNKFTSLLTFFTTFFIGIMNVVKMLVYGFSTKIIFHTSWSSGESFCVGAAIFLFLMFITDLFHSKTNI